MAAATSCIPTNVSGPPGCLEDTDCCAFHSNPSVWSGVFCDHAPGYAAARKQGTILPNRCLHNGGQADSALNMSSRSVLVHRLDDHFIVLPRLKALLCAIDKNGLSVQNAIARAIHADPHPEYTATVRGGLRFSPDRWDIDVDGVQRLLTDDTWRRIIVHRSPYDRFVSAYNSKCKNADGDGERHCWKLFGGENVSMQEVATRLLSRGLPSNSHWLPQARFCGGLTATYTHAVPFDTMATALPEALGVSQDTIAAAAHASGIPAAHVTNASGASQWLPAELREMLTRVYHEDVELGLGTPQARLCAPSSPACAARFFVPAGGQSRRI